jgi:hypothetical protein
MRKSIRELNAADRLLLSNDLGAATAFLFAVGSRRDPLPATDPCTAGTGISSRSGQSRPPIARRRRRPARPTAPTPRSRSHCGAVGRRSATQSESQPTTATDHPARAGWTTYTQPLRARRARHRLPCGWPSGQGGHRLPRRHEPDRRCSLATDLFLWLCVTSSAPKGVAGQAGQRCRGPARLHAPR